MATALGLVAVFLLVFMNGFFVAAEFALVGARRTRIVQLAAEGHAGARAAEQAINHLDSYIAATQLGITLASLGLGWIGEPAVAHLFEPLLTLVLPEDVVHSMGHTITIVLGFSLVTMLHIVLGELAPKSIALQRPEATSVLVARPTTVFLRVFSPVILLMNNVGNGVVRLLGFEPASGHEQVHSAEELGMLVRSSREAGLLEANEERLIQRVFDFGDIHVRAVMQPRVEVDALPSDMSLSDLLQRVSAQHHSRYPVYEGSIDRVIGILHTKDLLDAIVRQPDLLSGGADFDLAAVLRPPLFVPMMARADEVLERMKRTQTHLMIVVDEYGGMAGMVTMEDILEELVGDVRDEFDSQATPVRAMAEGTYSLDGLTSINEVYERFGQPEVEPQSTTIGGYIAEQLDRIPILGDTVPFGKYDVCVEEMDEMRVARVRFSRRVSDPPAAPEASPDGL